MVLVQGLGGTVKYPNLDFIKLTLFPFEIYNWFSVELRVGMGRSP